MPDLPETAVQAAADALQQHVHGGEADPWRERARVVLEAAAPFLADHAAGKILAHMDAHGPQEGFRDSLGASLRRAWRRHFDIAARIAAGAFMTEADLKRMAAEALNRGDYAACWLDDAGNPATTTEGNDHG